MYDIDDVGVFLGLDVGKGAHHGHGPAPAGRKVLDIYAHHRLDHPDYARLELGATGDRLSLAP